MKTFSAKYRKEYIEGLKNDDLDLLIIGGGITGAGILLDAQVRGMKAGLIEMQDFAAGTSSRSTKLVHGGLRYLKQLEIKLVAEVGRERAIVYENGPHVTQAETMLLPLIKGGSINSIGAYFGMWLYDFLAGVKKHEHRKMLSKKETIYKEPLLREDILLGGVHYYEYRTDDSRLTLEVIKEAVERKGIALNYMKAIAFLYKDGKVIGLKAEDKITGETHDIFAKTIVNATGPWVDNVDYLNDPRQKKKLHLTKGVHIVLDRKRLPLKQSIYFDTEGGRMVFAIPREGKTYVGTTDTTYSGNIENPVITQEDKNYLIDSVNYIFKGLNITSADVESGWAGLRPLIKQQGKDTTAISRKDEIFEFDSGLITIAGGKLTGYRKMAERILDLIVSRFKAQGKKFPGCTTNKIAISGGKVGGAEKFASFVLDKIKEAEKRGIPEEESRMLIQRYGSNIDSVFKIAENSKEEAGKNNLPVLLFAQLLYGIEEEMVISPSDFFVRRTGALYFNIDWVKKWEEPVSEYMSKYFDWPSSEKENYRAELEKYLKEAKAL